MSNKRVSLLILIEGTSKLKKLIVAYKAPVKVLMNHNNKLTTQLSSFHKQLKYCESPIKLNQNMLYVK